MTTDEKKKANKKGLECGVRQVRDRLNKALAAVRRLHYTAHICYLAGEFDGGKMRNLDDAESWLADTRTALTEFLKPI